MRARAEIVELREEEIGQPDDPCQVRRMVLQDPDKLFTLKIERCDGEDATGDEVSVRLRICCDGREFLQGAEIHRLTELPAFIAAAVALAQARRCLDIRSKEVARA